MTESVYEFIKAAREFAPHITWEYYANGCVVSKLMPLETKGDFYVGRCYYDVVEKKVEVLTIGAGPFQSQEEAQKYIDSLVF